MRDERTVQARVRAVLLTPTGNLLLIKRVRAGTSPYWVFPGGGVEAQDEDPESALLREVREETGGTATVRKLLFVLERDPGPTSADRELFYLADVASWDEAERSGPEFLEADPGAYVLDEFPLSAEEIEARDIKPDAMKRWLLAHHADLAVQPDLRCC
ncbi:MAG TPA: NUDIX hydrolase [Longimicrobium sp.]|nr:NUDIX hydrolase [Longimicrobium sp.]